MPPPSGPELRVLVVAPAGRDAELTCEILGAAGLAAIALPDLEGLAAELRRGAGAVIVAAEAMHLGEGGGLAPLLQAQESWSDLPVIFAIDPGHLQRGESPLSLLERAGTVTVLERPVRVVTLVSVVRSALRARTRQYELRDLVEQLRANVVRLDAERQVRERFVSLLAHDLRGPLGVVATSAQLLVARPQGAVERPEIVQRVQRASQRMERMIRDLLDANRLRAGAHLAISPVPCELADIVADALSELDPAARLRVRVSLPRTLGGVWSPEELRRAVWNLVTNALKYGAAGAPVEVRGESRGELVEITVHNEGPPIPPEERTRVFEPFGRGQGADAIAGGWGLGLTLVRGCAEAHGGELALTSTREGGTTFLLRLPRDARPPELRERAAARSDARGSAG